MTPHTPEEFLESHQKLPPRKKLEALVSLLRGPLGCPWDQRQSAPSILDFLIDEAHELKEALARGDQTEVIDELGDLCFTFTFLRQTLADQAPESLAIDRVVAKMIQRHPHVFDRPETGPPSEAEIKRKWETIKTADLEKSRRLDRDLPASLSATQKASKILTRARNAGFRYPTPEAAWEKVAEEWFELQEALEQEGQERRHCELGDLLLALLTAAVESGLDPEEALTHAGTRLADRLQKVEELAGKPLGEIPTSELGSLYSRAREESSSPRRVFLNYCGVSPWPGEVSRAVSRAARKVAREGFPAAIALLHERPLLKEKIARLVGSRADNVVLVPNVSSAALGVAYSLDWQAGDAVLLGKSEFPANTVPWRLAARTLGLRVLEFDEDELRRDPDAGWSGLARLLKHRRPRLVAFSAVSYWSGFRVSIPRLSALCREYGSLLFVDAIQALGTLPMTVEGIDFLACGSHKQLLGPEGAGFLVVAETARQHWVPRLGSWLSLPDPVDFLLSGRPDLNPNHKEPRLQDPTVLEGGSQNTLGYAGLSGAMDFFHAHGVERIHRHVQALHDRLEHGMASLGLGFQSLRSIDPEGRSAILSFDCPPGLDPVGLQAGLARAGVQVSIPRGRLRFGCHLANTPSDVEQALKAISASV